MLPTGEHYDITHGPLHIAVLGGTTNVLCPDSASNLPVNEKREVLKSNDSDLRKRL